MIQYTTILLLFAALQIKHLVADFFLQNAKMIQGREKYWHMGRAMHAGIHVFLTAICFALFGTSLLFISTSIGARPAIPWTRNLPPSSHYTGMRWARIRRCIS